MEPYLYFDGLLRLANEVKGNETVHVGVRPYGFHAGNAMALVVYPYLFCKYVESLGKRAQFEFIVSINDWEQDVLDGPNPRKYLLKKDNPSGLPENDAQLEVPVRF